MFVLMYKKQGKITYEESQTTFSVFFGALNNICTLKRTSDEEKKGKESSRNNIRIQNRKTPIRN